MEAEIGYFRCHGVLNVLQAKGSELGMVGITLHMWLKVGQSNYMVVWGVLVVLRHATSEGDSIHVLVFAEEA